MADADLEQMAVDAPYIFIGTVEHAAASSVAGTPADEQLEALAQAPLRARARKADLIVSGRVVDLSPLEGAGPETGAQVTSEHDPQWWHAEIAVDEVLKGKHQGGTVRVAFPSSADV